MSSSIRQSATVFQVFSKALDEEEQKYPITVNDDTTHGLWELSEAQQLLRTIDWKLKRACLCFDYGNTSETLIHVDPSILVQDQRTLKSYCIPISAEIVAALKTAFALMANSRPHPTKRYRLPADEEMDSSDADGYSGCIPDNHEQAANAWESDNVKMADDTQNDSEDEEDDLWRLEKRLSKGLVHLFAKVKSAPSLTIANTLKFATGEGRGKLDDLLSTFKNIDQTTVHFQHLPDRSNVSKEIADCQQIFLENECTIVQVIQGWPTQLARIDPPLHFKARLATQDELASLGDTHHSGPVLTILANATVNDLFDEHGSVQVLLDLDTCRYLGAAMRHVAKDSLDRGEDMDPQRLANAGVVHLTGSEVDPLAKGEISVLSDRKLGLGQKYTFSLTTRD